MVAVVEEMEVEEGEDEDDVRKVQEGSDDEVKKLVNGATLIHFKNVGLPTVFERIETVQGGYRISTNPLSTLLLPCCGP